MSLQGMLNPVIEPAEKPVEEKKDDRKVINLLCTRNVFADDLLVYDTNDHSGTSLRLLLGHKFKERKFNGITAS